ncbi:putative neck protein [Aeromonas phage P19]|uniref:Neck protein n=3 Tax=Caudoviricetes TaxID=2731619 RepID=A0A291LDG2_9CAUD|nr:head-tail adaptor Ad2 [Aeromonas phage AS-sw]ATI17416.1 neck protein [Aeromonas phage AS-szw]ATI18255.1 neck protein [Aeromonas phage AS-sw]QMV28721.1 neck protein [Aeromonas phage AP1]UKM62898.1 putative neck protein [Aeromonas phage P19]
MYNTCNNPKELKDNILRRLGAPIINIEVTETQIYDSIGRALELYKDYHHDALNRAFITCILTEEQAMTGYIDLSEYPVFAVTRILRSMVGNMTLLGGGVPLNWFASFITGLATSGVGSCYHGPFGTIGSVGYFAAFSSYQKLLQDQLNPLPDYDFDTKSGILQITHNNLKKGDVMVIEAYVQNFVDLDEYAFNDIGSALPIGHGVPASDLENKWSNPYKKLPQSVIGSARNDFPDQKVYNNRWVKDMSTALVKEVWGNIMAKHQGMQLPGGVTVDGTRLIQEAKQEIETLREELLLLAGPDPIIMG